MSKYEYPPSSNDTIKINHLLQVYKTVIIDRNAIYISTPMTSGLLYMKAFAKLQEDEKERGLTTESRSYLFNKNCQHARSVASMTRLHFPTSVVIDPTEIEIDGWEQNDYLVFWRQVIIDNVRIIRFVKDWHYSNGCAYEFLVGVETNKAMIDEDENVISPFNGRELIQKAYDEHFKNGYDNQFLQNVIKALDVIMKETTANVR